MLERKPHKNRAERWLEKSNTPILVLAALAVILYLLELFHAIPPSLQDLFIWTNFLIDFIFLVDIIAKAFILGRAYLRSPWFLIDFISTLPIISSAMELMGSMGPQLQATRVARGARIARIARVARIARLAKVARVARLATAIRAHQGLRFLKSGGSGETPRFNRALFIGVPTLLLAFIIANAYLTQSETATLKSMISDQLALVQADTELSELMAHYAPSVHSKPAELTSFPSPLHPDEDLIFSLHPAFLRADRISGIMLLLVLATIGVIAFVVGSLAGDRSHDQERSILSQCFSPAIVNKFYESPEIVERFFRQWMTVFFIDIRGFTRAAESNHSDVEGLAIKLRKVMDTARDQIVVSHEGVIDKFIGDAVMGWVGGHFSSHWQILADLHNALFMDQLELLDQDIKSIERALKQWKDGDDLSDQKHRQLLATLQKARTDRDEFKRKQSEKIDNNPVLAQKLTEATAQYRRQVAKSAVVCCLKISETVSAIDDPEAFHELKIGVGSGSVLVGNFGSTDQIGFTVLGPTVNRSARLEPASAQCGCKILIDDVTYKLLRDDQEFKFRRLPPIAIKGLASSVTTYEPFLSHGPLEFLNTFDQAVNALESGRTAEALKQFDQANELKPGGDTASQIWAAECKLLLQNGVSFVSKSMSK